jgi:hypothetical protein
LCRSFWKIRSSNSFPFLATKIAVLSIMARVKRKGGHVRHLEEAEVLRISGGGRIRVIVGFGLAPARPLSHMEHQQPPDKFTPIQICGTVVRGFGRGSKDLGIPTGSLLYPDWHSLILANMNSEAVSLTAEKLNSRYGIYYGWAWFPVDCAVSPAGQKYPMVMSFGLNPHYNNAAPSLVPIARVGCQWSRL